MSNRDTTGYAPSAQAEYEEDYQIYSHKKADNIMLFYRRVVKRRLTHLTEQIAMFKGNPLDSFAAAGFDAGILSARRSEVMFLENLLEYNNF